ncbi:MAG TPA: phosphotransferase, partial [Protaetiibacter sp.]|nr:phosphotransferase [Protaetiibacter sp.]
DAETHVMSHRDLIPANLLVDAGRLVGVLDGGDFGPADPALDLVAGWHLLDAGPRAAFRGSLGCGPAEWRRGAGWALVQAMGLVWYYLDTNPSIAALGRSTVTRLLEDDELGR